MASVIVVGKQKTRELELEGAVTVVGRDGGATLELGDLQVSRRHALLVRAAEGFFLKDLGSRNGVLVNKEKVPSRSQTRLKNGDVLSLGRTTLIFKDLATKLAGGDATQPVERTVLRAPAAARPAPAKPGSALAAAKARAAAKGSLVAGLKDAPAAKAPVKDETGSAKTGSGGPPPAPSPTPTPTPPEDPKKTDPRTYPRALPPPPSGSGSSDALMMRALERAERERVFYRNLVLVLTGVVIFVLVGLLLWALLHGRAPAAAPEAPAVTAAPTPARSQAADLSVLDGDVFAARVHPVLAAKCAGCHEQVGRAGGLVLAASDDPATVRANLAAIRRYVVPGRPQESPLLLEPLPAAEGGTGHGGGEVLTMASAEWQTLAAWIEQARVDAPPAPAAGPRNQAPTAKVSATPTTAPAGQPIALDGGASSDPDGAALTFRWTLRSKPEGSKAVLDRPGEPRTQLFADVPGAYVVALVVHDGQASAAAEVEVAATTTPERERAPAIAGAFEALCGRAPTEDEARLLAPLEGDALVKALADRPETFGRWWEAELAHLGLEGEHRPRGEPWASIPERLRAGRVSALDVLQALALGQAWSTRHAGREAAVDALLTRVLGLDPAAAKAERDAALRLFDGFEASFLGVQGAGQADLVRIAVSDPRAKRALLARAHQRVVGRPCPAPILDAAQAALSARPKELFALLAGWAAQRVP